MIETANVWPVMDRSECSGFLEYKPIIIELSVKVVRGMIQP